MLTITRYELRIRRERIAAADASTGTRLPGPTEVAELARRLIGDAGEEHFVVFHLDVKNRVLGFTEIARGGVDTCPVDPREAFRVALVLGASAIVAAHNHPSGQLEPSGDDIRLTERLRRAADILGLPLIDHVIVTDKDFYSFVAAGDMPHPAAHARIQSPPVA